MVPVQALQAGRQQVFFRILAAVAEHLEFIGFAGSLTYESEFVQIEVSVREIVCFGRGHNVSLERFPLTNKYYNGVIIKVKKIIMQT
jgi:hypothetical protein